MDPCKTSSICQAGLDGLTISGIFIQLLRDAFSHADNIMAPQLKDNLWNPMKDDPLREDPSKSKILIESVARWDARTIGQRPALLVRRNAYQGQTVGIGSNRVLTMGEPAPQDMLEWGREYAKPIKGGHTIFAITTESGSSEVLGWEVYRFLTQFGPVFEDEFSFLEFKVQGISDPSQLEESDEHYAVATAVEYSYYERWKLIPTAPRFAGVSLNVEGD